MGKFFVSLFLLFFLCFRTLKEAAAVILEVDPKCPQVILQVWKTVILE